MWIKGRSCTSTRSSQFTQPPSLRRYWMLCIPSQPTPQAKKQQRKKRKERKERKKRKKRKKGRRGRRGRREEEEEETIKQLEQEMENEEQQGQQQQKQQKQQQQQPLTPGNFGSCEVGEVPGVCLLRSVCLAQGNHPETKQDGAMGCFGGGTSDDPIECCIPGADGQSEQTAEPPAPTSTTRTTLGIDPSLMEELQAKSDIVIDDLLLANLPPVDQDSYPTDTPLMCRQEEGVQGFCWGERGCEKRGGMPTPWIIDPEMPQWGEGMDGWPRGCRPGDVPAGVSCCIKTCSVKGQSSLGVCIPKQADGSSEIFNGEDPCPGKRFTEGCDEFPDQECCLSEYTVETEEPPSLTALSLVSLGATLMTEEGKSEVAYTMKIPCGRNARQLKTSLGQTVKIMKRNSIFKIAFGGAAMVPSKEQTDMVRTVFDDYMVLAMKAASLAYEDRVRYQKSKKQTDLAMYRRHLKACRIMTQNGLGKLGRGYRKSSRAAINASKYIKEVAAWTKRADEVIGATINGLSHVTGPLGATISYGYKVLRAGMDAALDPNLSPAERKLMATAKVMIALVMEGPCKPIPLAIPCAFDKLPQNFKRFVGEVVMDSTVTILEASITEIAKSIANKTFKWKNRAAIIKKVGKAAKNKMIINFTSILVKRGITKSLPPGVSEEFTNKMEAWFDSLLTIFFNTIWNRGIELTLKTMEANKL
eukprot:TRINITY_DN3754_c0_g2_i5.p1 TRINITY_DN3754_c0_g2~~TRINITY_DN3754_c0_g2_i5.p1  ORF type:complete len:700 (-),score=131.60 TRINITY_DN3754_c0_g2_i5:31-2130(-)